MTLPQAASFRHRRRRADGTGGKGTGLLRGRWGIAGVAGAGLLVVGSVLVPLTTAPAAAATCSGSGGVSVVVDFAGLGGGVQSGCAAGDPSSGLGALQDAGFSYSFVPNRPGFVCRIAEQPNPCNGAPATAYWSYWYAQPGGAWTYSSLGAGSRDPAPGTAEGWAFGAGTAPSAAPPALAAPAPAPTPAPTVPPAQPAPNPAPAPTVPVTTATTVPPAEADPPAGAGPAALGPAAPAGGTPITSPAGARGTGIGTPAGAGTDGTTSVPVPSSSLPGAPGTDDGAPVVVPGTGSDQGALALGDLARAQTGERDGGSVGGIVGIVLVAGVGLGAVLIARRRRPSPDR